MQIGRLDRRIVIEVNTPTRSTSGEEVDSWATFATVWAAVVPIRGKEFFDAAAVQSEIDTKFRIRWRDDLTTKMRISYDGNIYDIHSIVEIGRHAATEIMASAHIEDPEAT